MLKEILGWLIPAIVGRARKLVKVSDGDLRAIARSVVGDGTGSWGQMFSEARTRCRDLGAELDDELDVRIGDELQEAIAALRLPGRVAEMADKAEDVLTEWERAERRGLERGRETARSVNDGDKPDGR